MNDITFITGTNGLGRQAPNDDKISGLVLYSASLPSGFSASDRIKQIFSVEDAEALGILDTYIDETQAVGSYTITAVGANGDTIKLQVTEPLGLKTIAPYTKSSLDTTVTLAAASLALSINIGTAVHGYSATSSVGVVTINARKGLGIALNSGSPLIANVTGTITGTIAQFAGGLVSKQAIYYYHISEYFRLHPDGNLFLGIFAVPGGTPDFQEVKTLQDFTNGQIKQVFVYNDFSAYATAQVSALQAVATQLEALYADLSIVYTADFTAVSNLATLTSARLLNAKNVSVVLGQDGGNLGYTLSKAYGKTISCAGALLGAISSAKVSEDIAWVGKFPISDGMECEVAGMANGQLYKNLSQGLKDQLDLYGFIFLRKIIDTTGTYFNDSHTASAIAANDFAYIENNRVIKKARSKVRAGLLPLLNSPLKVNADGTLSATDVAVFESAASQAGLEQMQRDEEISAFKVSINPNQNVLSTSMVAVTVVIVPIGTARQIVVTIGFATKL